MKKENMPENTSEEKVKRTSKRTAGEGKRKRLIRLSPAKARRWRLFFSLVSILLVEALALVIVMSVNHYKQYPGSIKGDSITSPGRGADYIVLGWDDARNADVYKVWYKESDEPAEEEPAADKTPEAEDQSGSEKEEVVIDDSWSEVETDVPEITVKDLKKDTSYSFVIRPDSKEKEGAVTEPRSFSTKKSQKIKVDKQITKFTFSKPFRLKADAATDLMYESSDPEVAEIDPETREIKINGEGVTDITVTARSSAEYESASKVVELEVIDAEPVSAGGASARIIYSLDSDNCEIVKRITGANGAAVPQGLGYTGDKYIVAYGMGNPNRMISFDVDGDGKDVSVPSISMGHPNGLAYADENGLCYCAKGWTSKVYTYEPTSDSYGSVNLSYGCSGIGYDRKEKLLYTCSRTAMVAYDISDGYSVKYRCGVVKHSGSTFTQDCGGHAGIMLRCLSGSSKHGTNYIDLYDMKNGRYLGTISCELSEVESCIVDNDGFLEILSNNSSSVDYIWKTSLNIETLGEGL